MRQTRWWLAGLAAVALLSACAGNEASKSVGSSGGSGSAPAAVAPATDQANGQRSVAATGAAGSGSEATNAAPAGAPATTDRKIIFNVSLDLTVKDVQSGFERISQIADANGGIVADSNVRQEGDQRRATVTIRVPVGRYQDVLAQIRGLAVKVDSERASANDVTEEYTDLQSRQRNLEATEQQLLVLLGQARNVQEILTVQDRLNSTRADIEKVKGRLNLLTHLTDLATIQAQLRPEAPVVQQPKPEHGPLAALRTGWEASLDVVGGVALVALTVAAFSWWLLPLAALGLWLYRREQRRRATPTAPVPLEGA